MFLRVSGFPKGALAVRWRWSLISGNNRLLAMSVKAFKTKSAARRSAEAVFGQSIFDEIRVEGEESDQIKTTGH